MPCQEKLWLFWKKNLCNWTSAKIKASLLWSTTPQLYRYLHQTAVEQFFRSMLSYSMYMQGSSQHLWSTIISAEMPMTSLIIFAHPYLIDSNPGTYVLQPLVPDILAWVATHVAWRQAQFNKEHVCPRFEACQETTSVKPMPNKSARWPWTFFVCSFGFHSCFIFIFSFDWKKTV